MATIERRKKDENEEILRMNEYTWECPQDVSAEACLPLSIQPKTTIWVQWITTDRLLVFH